MENVTMYLDCLLKNFHWRYPTFNYTGALQMIYIRIIFASFNFRKLIVQSSPTKEGQRIDVIGTDPEGCPFSYLKLVSVIAVR